MGTFLGVEMRISPYSTVGLGPFGAHKMRLIVLHLLVLSEGLSSCPLFRRRPFLLPPFPARLFSGDALVESPSSSDCESESCLGM